MHFDLLSDIFEVETIATGHGINELKRLARTYGKANWRKRKGIAKIKLPDGSAKIAEVHWYEGHGKGRFEIKIKKYLEI